MDEKRFQFLMRKAQTLAKVEPNRADYWAGYIRGLRRNYHGDRFGTEEDHTLWMSLMEEIDESRRQRGEGYRAGYHQSEEEG